MSARRRNLRSEGGLTCDVCLQAYNQEEHRPLMLPACGHTFCRLCLVGVLTKHTVKGQFLCPTCRRPQPIKVAEDLPTNYSLLELTQQEALFSYGCESFSVASPSSLDHTSLDERCPEHGSRLAFWCTTCEVAACGECLFEGHPRPEHNLARVEDHINKIQELMGIRSTRIVTQLLTVSEEAVNNVKKAFVDFMERLRQNHALSKLLEDARRVHNIAMEASDLGSLSSVNEALRSLEKEFKNAQIDTEHVVSVRDSFVSKSLGSNRALVISSPDTNDVNTEVLIDLQSCRFPADYQALQPAESTFPDRSSAKHYPDAPSSVIASFPHPPEEPSSIPLSFSPVHRTASKPPQTKNTTIPTRPPAIIPILSSAVQNICQSSNSDKLITSGCNSSKEVMKASVSTQTSITQLPLLKLESSKSEVHETYSQTETTGKYRTAMDIPQWPHLLCGTLSGNWTASKITLEPRGIHVYCLGPMQEKCDVILNLSVILALAPTEAPTVFMDLQDGCTPLGRLYITLQIHLRRAQQFFSLCLGDLGPSYKGSSFHSVLRRGDAGEGLAGGDYEGKAGKGGAAVLLGIEPNKEMPKRCEKGMVSRISTRSETSAQFCISVRDGPRDKPVFPFGRVCQGINVVDEACRRPSHSLSIANCGCVLPLQ